MKYSIIKGLKKVAKYVIFFGVPIIIDQFVVAYPVWSQITIGALLTGVSNYLKVKRVPVFKSL